MFLDALPAAGNAGSVSTMVKLISDKQVSSAKEMSWFTSLAFNPRPTAETIEALLVSFAIPFQYSSRICVRFQFRIRLSFQPFLQASVTEVKTDALLGVSSMIHTYCRLNEKCEESRVMSQVLGALQKLLGYKCRSKSDAEKTAAIGALKAFGNIGRHGSAAQTIKQCYEYPSTELSIRLAAIESYRRVPCTREEV